MGLFQQPPAPQNSGRWDLAGMMMQLEAAEEFPESNLGFGAGSVNYGDATPGQIDFLQMALASVLVDDGSASGTSMTSTTMDISSIPTTSSTININESIGGGEEVNVPASPTNAWASAPPPDYLPIDYSNATNVAPIDYSTATGGSVLPQAFGLTIGLSYIFWGGGSTSFSFGYMANSGLFLTESFGAGAGYNNGVSVSGFAAFSSSGGNLNNFPGPSVEVDAGFGPIGVSVSWDYSSFNGNPVLGNNWTVYSVGTGIGGDVTLSAQFTNTVVLWHQ
jgi:hypothetical protein